MKFSKRLLERMVGACIGIVLSEIIFTELIEPKLDELLKSKNN